MEIVYSYLFRKLRYCWYWLKRKKGKVKKMWDRFKWCLIGGFAYAAGRFAFHYLQNLL